MQLFSNHYHYLKPKPLRLTVKLIAVTLCLVISACSQHNTSTRPDPKSQGEDPAPAKNIILFLGDGMGISTVTAARIFAGQAQGLDGEEYLLSFEHFPHVALSKTYNSNQQTPDSAGTMSAIMTGAKTRAGVIAIQAEPLRNDCAASLQQGAMSMLELSEMAGLRTGIISTARLTHATPAATYAHAPNRHWESDARMPDEARQAGCRDIARQLIEFPFGDGLELALGGGRHAFMPATHNDPEYPERKGERQDGRDLTAEWQANRANAHYVWNSEQFNVALTQHHGPILGLFEPSHMQFEHDRPDDGAGEPSLSAMTSAAIHRLAGGEQGFFLMVEGGRIDHAHHATNAYRALSDTVAFADAVQTAIDMTDEEETLIIVTADHSHVFTMAGYPTRGNPILGRVIGNDEQGLPHNKPDLAPDELPYTTLSYANGPGFRAASRDDLIESDPTQPDFLQPTGMLAESETHGGEDVAIYAHGPGAHRIHGVMEQNRIFNAMVESHPELHAQHQTITHKLGWPADPSDVLNQHTASKSK